MPCLHEKTLVIRHQKHLKMMYYRPGQEQPVCQCIAQVVSGQVDLAAQYVGTKPR